MFRGFNGPERPEDHKGIWGGGPGLPPWLLAFLFGLWIAFREMPI